MPSSEKFERILTVSMLGLVVLFLCDLTSRSGFATGMCMSALCRVGAIGDL
jgi:hypothetical protein